MDHATKVEASNSQGKNVEANSPPEKKVLLFGATGVGKSTIANALVMGGIKPERFKTSDGARGCTAEIQKESGRGWTVTDTVGLGESDLAAVPIDEAKKMMTDFLKKFKHEYSHIAFVIKAPRITIMDELIWTIFTSIFKGSEDAFVVIFTGASENWLQENQDHLPEYLSNHRILVTDIPPIHRRRATERKKRAIRNKSIIDLQENLIKFFDERGNVYATPAIAGMTDRQLKSKAKALLRLIGNTIKRLFKQVTWQSVVARLATCANVADMILNILNMV